MRTKQVLVTGGLAAGVLLLAGCMSMEGDLTFDDQARADGQLSIAINKQAASLAGIASLDALKPQSTGVAGVLIGS
jgi:outer membrane murein-binding lipoprotein Lpp